MPKEFSACYDGPFCIDTIVSIFMKLDSLKMHTCVRISFLPTTDVEVTSIRKLCFVVVLIFFSQLCLPVLCAATDSITRIPRHVQTITF